MIHKIAEYTINEGTRDMVLAAIQEFVTAVRTNEPRVVTYDAYEVGDGKFIHFMTFEDAETESAHQSAEHTAKFVSILYPHCKEEPKFTDLKLIS